MADKKYEYQVFFTGDLEAKLGEGWEPVPSVPLIPWGTLHKIILRREKVPHESHRVSA